MLQRISQSSVAWQQRHPRGHGDMMIEWLSQCEQEAEGIRKSRHTQVSHCGVSLEEKPAERPQQGTPLDGGPALAGELGSRRLACPGAGNVVGTPKALTRQRLHRQPPAPPSYARGRCTLPARGARDCPGATPPLPPCQTQAYGPAPGGVGTVLQILHCGWEVSAKLAFTLDASGFCVPLSNALFVLTATRGSTWSHFRFSFFRGSLGLQQLEWDVLRDPVPSVPHARLPG